LGEHREVPLGLPIRHRPALCHHDQVSEATGVLGELDYLAVHLVGRSAEADGRLDEVRGRHVRGD
jgi:hypothetical protein